jgi:hypothetical protein
MLPAIGSVARAAQLSPTRFTASSFRTVPRPVTGCRAASGNFELPYIYKPLEKVRDQLVITSGMWSKSVGESAGGHGRGSLRRRRLPVRREAAEDDGRGHRVRHDARQMIAQKIGQETLTPSLQVAVEDPGANASNCGEGYSCVYTNTIRGPRRTARCRCR